MKTGKNKKTAPSELCKSTRQAAGKPVPHVSIIIPVFNNWRYTKSCLEGVLANSGGVALEVIVVDNGSTDATPLSLRQWQHPNLKIISLPANLGFAAACNIGCRQANGNFLVLLNNDTIVPPGWLGRLIRPLVENSSVGLAGPMTNNASSEQKLSLCAVSATKGAEPAWLLEFYRLHRAKTRVTDYLAFFCVAMRRDVFSKTGELDTNYTLGMFEDNDYCLRVKEQGYQLTVVEDAFVYHYGGASIKELPSHREIFIRNRAYFEEKWQTTWLTNQSDMARFLNSSKPARIAEALYATKTRIVLMLCGRPWPEGGHHCAARAENFLADGALVIVDAPTFYGQKIFGLKKAGLRLYFTNKLNMLTMCTFDIIVDCQT